LVGLVQKFCFYVLIDINFINSRKIKKSQSDFSGGFVRSTHRPMFPFINGVRKVDNSTCLIAGPPGPPGPPNPLTTITVVENYSEAAPGNINMNLIDMTLTSGAPVLHPVMVFNSAAPTGGNFNLGTPNVAFAGPGIGAGGGPGLGANLVGLGNILIISADANPLIPTSYALGGTIIYNFIDVVDTVSIALVNVDIVGWSIDLYDAASTLIATFLPSVLGTNSYQLLLIPGSQVARMEVTLAGEGGVGALTYVRSSTYGITYGYIGVIDDGTLNATLPTTLTGTYQILVESILADGCCVVFHAAKSTPGVGGALVRTISSAAATLELLNIRWNPGLPIQLYHSTPKFGATGAMIIYKFSLISL
jgi:hypothetical protein